MKRGDDDAQAPGTGDEVVALGRPEGDAATAVTTTPPSVAPVPIYSTPTLRPCREIMPERGDVVTVGLQDVYGALVTDLPLGGAASMAPTATGGVDLCDRLRAGLPWMTGAIELLDWVDRNARLSRPWPKGDPDRARDDNGRQLLRGLRSDAGCLAFHDPATGRRAFRSDPGVEAKRAGGIA